MVAVVWTESLWWMGGVVESHSGRLKRELTRPVDVVELKLRHNWPIEFSFDAPTSKNIKLDPFMVYFGICICPIRMSGLG